jgi:hypothetical protein
MDKGERGHRRIIVYIEFLLRMAGEEVGGQPPTFPQLHCHIIDDLNQQTMGRCVPDQKAYLALSKIVINITPVKFNLDGRP